MSFCNSLTFFRIWTLAKTQPISNVSWQSHAVHLVNINVHAKFHHNIPLSSRDRAIFTFSEFGARQSLDRWKMAFRNLLELDLVNINVSANFYQNIPNGLRIKFHCFQNLNLGKTSTNPKCHLTISWATSCQYQCVCRISSQYSTQFKRLGHFHFFRIWSSAKPRPMKNIISQSLGLDLLISMFLQKFIKIFHSVQEIGLFSLFQNLSLGNTSANPKWHLTISLATSCQYQWVCKILSKYSKRFKSYRHFSWTGRRQNLYKHAGVKIFTNCPVTKSNVWL